MQNLSAYLLESPVLPDTEVAARAAAVSGAIREWLSQKGVTDPTAEGGSFRSLTTNGNGMFARKTTANEKGTLEELRLEEMSRGGQLFTTAVYSVLADSKVSVHVTLAVTNRASVIAPIATDPRCPAVVRRLLALFPDWMLGSSRLGQAQQSQFLGKERGTALAARINSDGRALPLVVVSENEGEQLWPDLTKELAFDLAGLAQVAAIDGEASWALTDALGKRDSCYLGAVRLYWPIKYTRSGETLHPGTVWTASSLLSNDHDGKGMVRLRSILRRNVMTVASLTVEPPSEIRDIQNFAARQRLQDLEKRAASYTDELELARLYVSDNEQLRAELAQAKSDLSRLNSRVEAAEFALNQVKAGNPDLPESAEDPSDEAPENGEIRYYKKTHSRPGHDVLVRVTDCGHSTWQSSAKADKAKKGLEKLEGRSDWKAMQHCGSCTGGGMWKVRW